MGGGCPQCQTLHPITVTIRPQRPCRASRPPEWAEERLDSANALIIVVRHRHVFAELLSRNWQNFGDINQRIGPVTWVDPRQLLHRIWQQQQHHPVCFTRTP